MNKERDLKIICPFCNKQIATKVRDKLYAATGCDTCGPEVAGTIEIKCANCKKIIYKKEY